MNERIMPVRPRGNNRRSLRLWGLFILLVGVVGQVLMNQIPGLGIMSMGELAATFDDSTIAGYSIGALIIQLLQSCAIPIFAFMLVDGVMHTSSFRNYFLRVLGLALISEIPYDLLVSGKIFDMSSQNPVFGTVLSMVLIFFYRQYAGKSLQGILIPAAVLVISFFWVAMLSITDGTIMIILVTVLWLTRKKLGRQVFCGCIVAFVCTALSPFYILAPMMFLAIHFYNGEPDEGNPWFNYLAYPAMLLAGWLVSTFAL